MQPEQRRIEPPTEGEAETRAGPRYRTGRRVAARCVELFPVCAHLASPAPVDEAHAEQGKTCEGAEEDPMRQTTVASRCAPAQSASARRSGWRVSRMRPGRAGSKRSFCAPPKENGLGRAMASARIRQTG